MRTRNGLLPDAQAICDLIGLYSHDGTLLPRSLGEICENVRDFVVAEHEGKIIGCGALHLYGPHLAEVRSIAVHPSAKGKGTGRLVVNTLLRQAKRHRVSCVCLFTRIPEFFAHIGFHVTNHENVPDKILKDCVSCPRLHACDEVAMIRGELPQFSFLRQENFVPLVQLSHEQIRTD